MHLIELAMAREVIRSGIADMMKGIDDTEVSNVCIGCCLSAMEIHSLRVRDER